MQTLARNPRGKVQVGTLPDSKSLTDREFQWIGSTGPGDILGTLIVSQGKELTTYFVDEGDADGEPGRVYLLAKQHQRLRSGRLSPEPTGVYRVFIGVNGSRRHCNCPGFGRHGTCKHADTIAELAATDALTRPEPSCGRTARPATAKAPPEPEPVYADPPFADDIPVADWPDELRNEPTYADDDDEFPDADHWTDDGGEG